LPKERFDKDIELAKLQAKISDRFSMYYAMLGALFVIYATFYVAIATMPSTDFTRIAQGGTIALAILLFFILIRDMNNWRNKFRTDFASIYNGKRIRY
jgi:hypothetical protein